MSKNKNLKALNDRMKRTPRLKDVARYAGISHPHLSNIVAGRRKASPELINKIETGFRRVMK